MSSVSLMLRVGGTSMVVDMADHFNPVVTPARNAIASAAECRHCGALTADYETHLVWHISVAKDLSAMASPVQAGGVMPQDVDGDEVGAPERGPRNLKACKTCGHQHLGLVCGQPWRGNPANPCPCDQPQEQ